MDREIEEGEGNVEGFHYKSEREEEERGVGEFGHQ